MNARRYAAVAVATTFALFALAETAFADSGAWTSLAASTPGRVALGLGGVLFAAALTRARTD